ncbi:hypothetical protein [Mesorhizobium sp.]|uniref:hypothetical protein n=1 Tax=Mesorhizobium sp. TaxID=1871066 RepID=UPI000FE86F37|nr:hypothetical protein [Mesorhizobium sp.]RWQ14808.1 MAG: hypothetical protein EOR93_27890 [Mesorhizobium sp.]
MLKRIIVATLAGTVLITCVGAAWAQDARFIFRYRAGLILPVGADINTPGDGGDGGESQQQQYTDVELSNGWHLYCPAAPATSAASLAHLVGASIALKIDVDTIYTAPDGSGPRGVFIYYNRADLPDAYGFEAYLDPETYGCLDEWGGVAILPRWSKPDRDSAVGSSVGGAVSSVSVGGMTFMQRPPH